MKRNALGTILVFSACFFAIIFSDKLSMGIKSGLELSLNLVIPSMFFFMILSNFIINSRAKALLARPFYIVFGRIIKLSEYELSILLLSLIGGYPVGAKLICEAVKSNTITREKGSKMLSFCVNCGPPFLITGVGAAIFSSISLGVVLYASQVIACFIIAFLSMRSFKEESPTFNKIKPTPSCSFSVLFVNSVTGAIHTMAIICGFIVAFSAFMPLIDSLLAYLGSPIIVKGLLEVTSGCSGLSGESAIGASSSGRALLAALFTSFGGVCVHLQVVAMKSGSGISMKSFYRWRIPYVCISVLITYIAITLFPFSVSCFDIATAKRQIFTVSPISAIFLAILSIMLLFFTRKSGNIKNSISNINLN